MCGVPHFTTRGRHQLLLVHSTLPTLLPSYSLSFLYNHNSLSLCRTSYHRQDRLLQRFLKAGKRSTTTNTRNGGFASSAPVRVSPPQKPLQPPLYEPHHAELRALTNAFPPQVLRKHLHEAIPMGPSHRTSLPLRHRLRALRRPSILHGRRYRHAREIRSPLQQPLLLGRSKRELELQHQRRRRLRSQTAGRRRCARGATHK